MANYPQEKFWLTNRQRRRENTSDRSASERTHGTYVNPTRDSLIFPRGILRRYLMFLWRERGGREREARRTGISIGNFYNKHPALRALTCARHSANVRTKHLVGRWFCDVKIVHNDSIKIRRSRGSSSFLFAIKMRHSMQIHSNRVQLHGLCAEVTRAIKIL